MQLNSVTISEAEARRAANRYLTLEVGVAFSAADPVYIALEQPLWQFSIRFRLPRHGTLAMMGTVDVDAQTCQVRRLSNLRTAKSKNEPMPLLNLRHQRQHHEADCLVACSAMVLEYLQIPIRS